MSNPNPSPATRFKPGNKLGGRRQPITAALAKSLNEDQATQIAKVVLEKALAGDPWAIGFLADRVEGKAIARNENGEPGDFDLTMQQVRKALGLKVVK